MSCAYMTYYPTVMAQYDLFVLKLPLIPKQTNKQAQVEHACALLPGHTEFSSQVEWAIPFFAFQATAGTHLSTAKGWKAELTLVQSSPSS